MKALALLLIGLALVPLSGCVAVKEKPSTSETTVTTEETTMRTPAVSETRTIRSY